MDGIERMDVGRAARLSRIGLAMAVLTSGASMAGWMFGIGWLRGFGIANYPDWPLTALCHLTLALSLWLMLAGRARGARAVLWLPLFVALITLGEYASGMSLGIDRLLMPQAVGDVRNANPGRPGLIPAISILLLCASAWLTTRRDRRAGAAILVLCTLTVGLGSMSIALLMLGADLTGEPFRLASSLPAALSPIGLSLGFIAWRAGSERAVRGTPLEWSIARLALPAIIVLPAVLFPLEVRLTHSAPWPPIAVEILASVLNLVVVVALLAWAMLSLQRETAALRMSERRLALATESHGVGIFEWNVRTGAVAWSDGAEERLGLPVGTITDMRSWQAHVMPGDADTVLATIADASARNAPRYTFRYRLRRPDGEIRQIEGSAHCLYDGSGGLLFTLGVNVDVTERDRREAELRSIVETVPEALVVIDEGGRIRRFSPAAERMFGWRADEVVGSNVARLMPDDQGRQHDGYLARYFAGGERRVIGQTRMLTARRKDGAAFPVEVNVGEAWTAGERLFPGFISDISERVAALSRLEEMRIEHGHSARLAAMGEMAAGLAHELNQPLAAGANFLGTAELVIGRDATAAAEAIGKARAQLLRAGAIIRRLRDFLAKGEAETDEHPVTAMIEDALALGLLGRDRTRIAVDLRLDAAAPTVMADRVQIQQVLVNLLRNAAEALDTVEGGGRVTVSTQAIDGRFLRIAVHDNGPGLSPDILDRLYSPFVSTKRERGMGVGLSICRRIVEAHGGVMTAENAEGGGARLSFTVPRPAEDGAA